MKKVVECLCVVASAVDSEANGLLTVLLRLLKGSVLGEGVILLVDLTQHKECGP